MTGRRFVLALAVSLLAAPIATPGSAQDYPSRPVRFIVPFGAGGPADVYARVIAQHLSEQLKQNFIVDDRPGAGSIIGAGTLIPEKTIVEPGSLWVGSPGKFRRKLDEKDQASIMRYANNYLGYKESYLAEK